jgi:hypothetical protein
MPFRVYYCKEKKANAITLLLIYSIQHPRVVALLTAERAQLQRPAWYFGIHPAFVMFEQTFQP